MKDAKDSVTAVANLLDDNKLQQHLDVSRAPASACSSRPQSLTNLFARFRVRRSQQINELMAASEDQHGIHRNVDREAEYPVIVRSNEV